MISFVMWNCLDWMISFVMWYCYICMISILTTCYVVKASSRQHSWKKHRYAFNWQNFVHGTIIRAVNVFVTKVSSWRDQSFQTSLLATGRPCRRTLAWVSTKSNASGGHPSGNYPSRRFPVYAPQKLSPGEPTVYL